MYPQATADIDFELCAEMVFRFGAALVFGELKFRAMSWTFHPHQVYVVEFRAGMPELAVGSWF